MLFEQILLQQAEVSRGGLEVGSRGQADGKKEIMACGQICWNELRIRCSSLGFCWVRFLVHPHVDVIRRVVPIGEGALRL